MSWFKRKPVVPPLPPPPKTDREKRIDALYNAVQGLSNKGLVYLQGVALHAPDMFKNPDFVTAAALANIQMKIGIQAWQYIVEADPLELNEACEKQMRHYYAAAYIS